MLPINKLIDRSKREIFSSFQFADSTSIAFAFLQRTHVKIKCLLRFKIQIQRKDITVRISYSNC
ncbi:hypothetical protein LEP1GSC194_2100 [Leptospira alstonii serovar Sichuan str. 79601]|uniref:Uncharacterized protein n=1 Tax=Leptospira alstonii serovar Sichuan str. 79601 TaxID=1218565 RepID=M6D5M1_9LEPT|nr:hypothetical protein LEP1GSC194_2100 [Leptospira alstonii serovar Sichuan str. 79601]